MSNYPTGFDDDSTLPAVNDNLTEIGGDAINALRDAVVQIETTLGLNIAGTQPSLAARLGVFINPDGTPNASVITSLGLVTLPIRNDQIAENAQIPESKLRLDFRTQDLFNYVRDLSLDVNTAIGWIATEGIKLEPHLIGAIYRHTMDQIDVSTSSTQFLKNKLRAFRDNLQSYTLVNDMNNELLAHQWADGSAFGPNNTVVTNNGSVYSTYFAHVASGIFLDPSRFSTIPQTRDNLQLFAEYIDTASIFLLGTRIQNLYTSGISRVSRSSTLTIDGYGQFIVPPTPAIAFLENIGNSGTPFDDINSGDDIIKFVPSAANQTSFYFASQFVLVRPGDIIRVLYGDGYNIMVPYVVKETKINIATNTFIVRIAGKNQAYSPNAIARIDRPLFNANKFGELSISPVNNKFSGTPSLIINNPRSAQALGLGFDPEQFDEKHYLLYLGLYPTGFAQDGYVFLPAIDVTGNEGTTPGLYTLESIVQATNEAFRAPGYNYRFTAFAKDGEFGICLADSYNNSAFSIFSVVMSPSGTIDSLQTSLNFPNNVVDLLPTVGTVAPDPLGFGPSGSGVASPPFMFTYGSAAASTNPAKLFVPLRRNNYYVNGSELERLAIPNTYTRLSTQAEDGYGDGYWVATVQDVSVQVGRVQTTYRIFQDLSITALKIGKTIVVQSLGSGSLVDFGRFIIQSVTFNCAPDVYTDITVYDAVHAKGFSPTSTIQPFSQVAIYFSDDSVSFNAETATDHLVVTPFKRNFEVYVNNNGETFTHERGRINVSGGTLTVNGTSLFGYSQLAKLDIMTISPKLRGYQFGSVNKITLNITSFVSATGVFSGYLASYDGITFTHLGPVTTGKIGEVIRFYDETNVDYIEIIFDVNESFSDFSNQVIDFQLFPTLQLDDEIMLIGTCQVNDSNKTATRIVDRRQFGNISEKDLSSSVFDYMSIPEKHLHSNGVIRGIDIANTYSGAQGIIHFSGGVVLVNGKFINMNNDTVSLPLIKEVINSVYYPVKFAVCINQLGEYVTVPLLDFDSTVGNPNTGDRIFKAADFVSSTTYNMSAVFFADLVNDRTDLTMLYTVSTVITGTPSAPSIAFTVKDVRKFIYKKDWGELPTLTTGVNNGEFRTIGSLVEWFKFNPSYTNSAFVKGTFTSIPSPLSFSTLVKLFGDGVSVFSTNTALTTSNVEYNHITFSITSPLTLSDVTLNNCILSGGGSYSATSSTFNNVTSSISSISLSSSTVNDAIMSGVTSLSVTSGIINDTTITSSGTLTLTNSTFNNVVFNLQGTNSVSFSGCTLNHCIINCTSNSSTITFSGSSSVLNNTVINFNVTGNTVNLTGLASACKFNYNSSSNPIAVSGSINILGCQFTTGVTTLTTQFITVPDGTNGLISGNFFSRGGNTLAAYIMAPSTYTNGVVAIVDNHFDNTTIDGFDQNLVKFLPISWPYKNNTNTPSTCVAFRTTTGGTYNVTVNDDVIALNLSSAITINLPNIALSPPGRTLTIKDSNGKADTFPITLHRHDVVNEAIENLYTDYVYKNPYGSITLVATIDPAGGGNGSGLPPVYMWVIV